MHLFRNNGLASIVYAYFEYSVHHTTSQINWHKPEAKTLILVPTQLGSSIIKTENNIALGT